MKNEFFGHLTFDESVEVVKKLSPTGKYLDINLNAVPATYEIKKI